MPELKTKDVLKQGPLKKEVTEAEVDDFFVEYNR